MGIENGAKTAVMQCMKVRKGEYVMVVSDPPMKEIAEAVLEAAQDVTPYTYHMIIPPMEKDGEEPGEAAAAAMRECDVVFLITSFSLSHTNARKNASRYGTRIASMPGVAKSSLESGGLTADYEEVLKNIRDTAHRVRNSSKGRIMTKAGTDLSFTVGDRKWITNDTGICQSRGTWTNLPAGEVLVAPIEDETHGVIVVDGSFNFSLVKKPLTLTVENGVVTDVKGDEKLMGSILSLKENDRTIGGLGFGMNPAARIIGNRLEDAKVLGSARITMGENLSLGGNNRSKKRNTMVIRDISFQSGDAFVFDEGKRI